MSHRGGWYEDGATTISRNKARAARHEQNRQDDRKVAAAEMRQSKRSI